MIKGKTATIFEAHIKAAGTQEIVGLLTPFEKRFNELAEKHAEEGAEISGYENVAMSVVNATLGYFGFKPFGLPKPLPKSNELIVGCLYKPTVTGDYLFKVLKTEFLLCVTSLPTFVTADGRMPDISISRHVMELASIAELRLFIEQLEAVPDKETAKWWRPEGYASFYQSDDYYADTLSRLGRESLGLKPFRTSQKIVHTDERMRLKAKVPSKRRAKVIVGLDDGLTVN